MLKSFDHSPSGELVQTVQSFGCAEFVRIALGVYGLFGFERFEQFEQLERFERFEQAKPCFAIERLEPTK